jgi:hypothetical protein
MLRRIWRRGGGGNYFVIILILLPVAFVFHLFMSASIGITDSEKEVSSIFFFLKETLKVIFAFEF